jgi:hypothetical protein
MLGGALLQRVGSLVVWALPLTLAMLLALYAGRAIAFNSFIIAFGIAGFVIALVVWSKLTPAGWCILLILTTLAARGPVAMLDLPGVLNFVHYVVLAGFCLWVLLRPPNHSSSAPTWWLLSFLLLTLVSLAAGFSHPVRALLFVLIAGEPLFVVWAVHRAAPDPRAVRTVAIVAIALMAVQVPWGLYQGFTLHFGDPVQGTLTTLGAGSHILGALFAICLFVVSAALALKRIGLAAGAALAFVCFGMMLATASAAVTILGTLAAVAAPWLAVRIREGLHRGQSSRWGLRIGATLIAIPLAWLALTWLPERIGGFEQRLRTLARVEEAPEVLLVERRREDPVALIFGSGPGTTSSRASILLALPPGNSPIGLVGLPPTRLGIEYAYGTRAAYGGSAERFASGALGIVGDLGLLGFAWLIAFLVSIWRLAGRVVSVTGIAVRGSLLMISALLFLDNWLEYPEFAVPWAILVAFGIRRPVEGDAPPAPSG